MQKLPKFEQNMGPFLTLQNNFITNKEIKLYVHWTVERFDVTNQNPERIEKSVSPL